MLRHSERADKHRNEILEGLRQETCLPGEGPEARVELLLHLPEQFLRDPVRHGPTVEEGDEDVREGSLNVPEKDLRVSGVDEAGQDVPLEGLLPEGSPGVGPEEVHAVARKSLLGPVSDEQLLLGWN